jgi:hypothetical protein
MTDRLRGEEQFQSGQDDVSDVRACTHQHAPYRSPLYARTLAEGYVHQDYIVELRFWTGVNRIVGPSKAYRAICVGLKHASHDAVGSVGRLGQDVNGGNGEISQQDVPVLVSIGEITESGEWVNCSPILSRERLERFDDLRGVWVDITERASDVAIPLILPIEDGELDLFGVVLGRLAPEVNAGEGKDQSIQRASDIVNDVSDQEAPVRRDILEARYCRYIASFFQIVLGTYHIGLITNELPEGLVERAEVSVRPVELSAMIPLRVER